MESSEVVETRPTVIKLSKVNSLHLDVASFRTATSNIVRFRKQPWLFLPLAGLNLNVLWCSVSLQGTSYFGDNGRAK